MDDLVVAFWMNLGIAAVEAALLIAVFRKAGFGWPLALAGLAPLVGLAIQFSLIFLGSVTPSEGVALSLPLALLTFLILTFKSWPLAAPPATSPETFQ